MPTRLAEEVRSKDSHTLRMRSAILAKSPDLILRAAEGGVSKDGHGSKSMAVGISPFGQGFGRDTYGPICGKNGNTK